MFIGVRFSIVEFNVDHVKQNMYVTLKSDVYFLSSEQVNKFKKRTIEKDEKFLYFGR